MRVRPSESANSALMAFKCSQELLSLGVPEVDNACVSPCRQILPTEPRPANGSYQVFILAVVMELSDSRARGIPDVDTL
jgi:hypothetical protein